MSALLDTFKARFDKEVNTSHICYDWDGGHCYSAIDHPIQLEAEQALAGDDFFEWEDYTNDWLSENEGVRYCVPPLVTELNPNKLVALCGCVTPADNHDPNYIEGFVKLVKQNRPGLLEHYGISLLEEWLADHRAVKKFDQQFES